MSNSTEALPEADQNQIQQECDELQAELQVTQEKYVRALAEFDNFRKRIAKEQEDHARFANENVLKSLLPVLDDLDRVLDHVPLQAEKELKQLADGVALMQKSFFAILEKFSLRVVETAGKTFDPTQHEAIAAVESDQPADSILAVHRKGYWLGDRLLRPALVTIAQGK